MICEKHPLPAKMKKFLTPENYYEDCFGIYRMENVPVEKIRIPSPLDLAVRPRRDFLQALLWYGRNIIVLKPESLRQEMIGILKDITKSYETG